MSVQLSQPERAAGVSVGKRNLRLSLYPVSLSSLIIHPSLCKISVSEMGFAHLQVTAAASGDIVAPLLSTVRLIPSLLLQVLSMDRQQHQPTRLRRANVLKAMSGMISVLTKITVALNMDIVDPASSTAISQPLTTEVTTKKLEHAVESFHPILIFISL